MDPLLDVLNPAQREAVQAGEGPVLVLAGPGSGKTRVLTHRVAYLVGRLSVPPYRIMAVTFTNKAAREMKARLVDLIGAADLASLTIGTFHATCAAILRRDGTALGIDSRFLIYDTSDQENLVKKALADLNLDGDQHHPAAVLAAISGAKNDLQGPDDMRPANYRQEIVRRVYSRYQALLRDNNALDFDDLLLEVVRLFRQHPDLLARYRHRYHSVLVDEFQDTNYAQYEIVRLLAQEARHVFAVGDEDQSIYSWRGADFRNVRRFRRDFPEARLILLEQNYRSTQTILEAACEVIRHNVQRTDKRLWTGNEPGLPIMLFEAYDEHEEAQYVVDEIQRLVARGECRPAGCAVMYRINAQSRVLEDEFVQRGLPYRVVGATRFYGRREIKDALAYLRLIYSPGDAASIARVVNVPTRGIGSKTVASFQAWADELGLSWDEALHRLAGDESEAPVDSRSRRALLRFHDLMEQLRRLSQQADLLTLFDDMLLRTGYADLICDGTDEGAERWQNIQELRTVAREYVGLPPGEALGAFLTSVALVSDVDTLRDEADAVTLLTLHAAKGLEFDAVFLVGMEERLFPHSRCFDDPNAMEEERRLCYVGLTRARQRLYLVYTFRRTIYGTQELSEPSRFLYDIPAQMMRRPGSQEPARPIRLRERLVAPRAPAAPAPLRQGATYSWPARRRVPLVGGREPQPKVLPELPPEPEEVRLVGGGPQFSAGDRVSHPSFGQGVVIASAIQAGEEEVTVAFEGRGIKRLIASYAGMEKLT
jgi:DNA helicase-2/ATP-dependent DNA helicase PcrA